MYMHDLTLLTNALIIFLQCFVFWYHGLFSGRVSYEAFKAKWTSVIKYVRCEAETRMIFFVLASSSGEGSNDFITRDDANGFFDVLCGEGINLICVFMFITIC